MGHRRRHMPFLLTKTHLTAATQESSLSPTASQRSRCKPSNGLIWFVTSTRSAASCSTVAARLAACGLRMGSASHGTDTATDSKHVPACPTLSPAWYASFMPSGAAVCCAGRCISLWAAEGVPGRSWDALRAFHAPSCLLSSNPFCITLGPESLCDLPNASESRVESKMRTVTNAAVVGPFLPLHRRGGTPGFTWGMSNA